METTITDKQSNENLYVSDEIKGYLLETARWGKFLAIVGYVFLGIMLIVAMFLLVGSSIMGDFAHAGMPMALPAFLYLAMAVIYFFPVNYLFTFSVRIIKSLQGNNNMLFAEGFKNLKSLFKFTGIMMIIVISLYIVAFIIAMLVMMMQF